MKNCLKLSVSLLAILTLSIESFASEEVIPHKIDPTGKVVIKKSTRYFPQGKIQIYKGTDSTEDDKDTGAIHNHDQIIILRDGGFTGDGKIVNYETVEQDAERTRKRDSTYATKESEILTGESDLAESAYYDFAHREQDTGGTKVEEFYTADQATIKKSEASTREEYNRDQSGEYITYDESRVGVRVEHRGGFVQKNTKANKSYYLGTLAEKGGLTSVHSSTVKDEIPGSIHSLRGYTKLTREQTIQGLIYKGHKFIYGEHEISSSDVSRIVSENASKSIILTETIDGQIYTTTIDTEGKVKTDNPNQVAALPEGQTGTAFSFERKLEDGNYSYIPVLVPEVDERLTIVKTMPEGTEKNQYEAELNRELEESRRNGSFIFEEWKSDDPVTEYSGANSWYNGVFRLEHGAVVIPNTAELVGGRVELGKVPEGYSTAKAFHEAIERGDRAAIAAAQSTAPTEFEFQGGPKDEYNRPAIYMNGNSSLFFNVTPDSEGHSIFSFYGSLHGTEQDRVIVQNGEIRWKGDGSGYKGRLAITEGAKFEVRSSDAESSSVYSGVFPNANVYQIYEEDRDGHKAGELVITPTIKTTIDTAGIDNITINNGYMRLTNEGDEEGGKLTLASSTLERNSFVEIAGESEVEGVTVKGVAVADGKMKAKSLTLQGGVLAVQGSIETENAELGSTIALWGNDHIDRNLTIGNETTPGTLRITDNHTLKLFIDADPRTGETDDVRVQRGTVIHSGNGVQIGGINFINNNLSSIVDSQTFQVISGGTATNIPVEIGAIYTGETNATFVAYKNVTGFTTLPSGVTGGTADPNSDVRYNYGNPTTGTRLQTSPLNDGSGGWRIQDGTTVRYIYGSDIAGYGNYVIRVNQLTNVISGDNFAIPVQSMHLTALSGVSQILGLVTDDYGYVDKYQTGKFGFWNKTFGGKDKFETNTSNDIKSTNYGTIFGFDAKPVVVGKSTTEFMGTVFGGVSHKNMKFIYQTQEHKANQNSYIAGLKGAFFNSKSSLELIGSYQLVKSESKKNQYSVNIKSHLYSFGAKGAYNFNLTDKLSLRPSLLVDYTFAKTPSYSVISTGTTNVKNIHRVDVVPEIALNAKFGQWKTNVFANYHRRFGSKGTYTFRGTEYKDITKKNHIEFGVGIDRQSLDNKTNVGLKFSKKTGGVKGFKASINVGFKF